MSKCWYCGGSGAEDLESTYDCPVCMGEGVLPDDYEPTMEMTENPECRLKCPCGHNRFRVYQQIGNMLNLYCAVCGGRVEV